MMKEVTFSNYSNLLYNGALVMYDNRIGTVERDTGWGGGFKINGRSIKNLLEEFDVMLVSSGS
jgi:hypothetical protein